jgi:hypothetical protein
VFNLLIYFKMKNNDRLALEADALLDSEMSEVLGGKGIKSISIEDTIKDPEPGCGANGCNKNNACQTGT